MPKKCKTMNILTKIMATTQIILHIFSDINYSPARQMFGWGQYLGISGPWQVSPGKLKIYRYQTNEFEDAETK